MRSPMNPEDTQVQTSENGEVRNGVKWVKLMGSEVRELYLGTG